MDELLIQLEALKNKIDEGYSEKLDKKSRKDKAGQEKWWSEEMEQRLIHRGKMFDMVYFMTIITYFVVFIIILSQVIDLNWSWPPIQFIELSDKRLALILTGFLAELLLLPQIILRGLFGERKIGENLNG